MCRGIAKAVHFGLNNPDAAVRIHWKLYPQSKPQGTDEAKLLSDSRRVFMSRFADYELHDTKKYGESLAKQWDDLAGLMKEQGLLPADLDVKQAYTNEFVDQINDWDRGRIEAQAKAWVPA
jgi:NitT/TauT family transport system substrate-binding protein